MTGPRRLHAVPQPAGARRETEAEFQQAIIDLATAALWRCYHTYDSRRSTPGFPDLVLLRPPEVLFVELKTDKGRLSLAQQVWLRDLGQLADAITTDLIDGSTATVAVHVWRPADWPTIEQRLTRRPETPHRKAATT